MAEALERAALGGDPVLYAKGGARPEKTTQAPTERASRWNTSKLTDAGVSRNDTEGERKAELKVRCKRHAAQFEESLETGVPFGLLLSLEEMLVSHAGSVA